ncbi:MAG: hypothetical protein K2X93_28485 [Candidatus Obscuribacterales bacterium]|nr:hypothetical protein [Candidatus Obscuribacterales bacterium]
MVSASILDAQSVVSGKDNRIHAETGKAILKQWLKFGVDKLEAAATSKDLPHSALSTLVHLERVHASSDAAEALVQFGSPDGNCSNERARYLEYARLVESDTLFTDKKTSVTHISDRSRITRNANSIRAFDLQTGWFRDQIHRLSRQS